MNTHIPDLLSKPNNTCHVLFQGNTTGDVYVYDTSDGKRMTHVAPIKVSAPVRACGLSPDCRHLLAVVGNGFIFRFEYRKGGAEVCLRIAWAVQPTSRLSATVTTVWSNTHTCSQDVHVTHTWC